MDSNDYKYGEYSGKTEKTTIIINEDYVKYCRKTHKVKDKAFQYEDYQTNQRFEWDCGVACLNTLLSITENEAYNINHMHAMYFEYSKGLESLCWTIDYFLFLKQFVKPLSQTLFFTKHFGANDAYKTDPFYDGFDKEEERVNKAFEYAKEKKMKIYDRLLSKEEFRTLAAMEDIYMLVCVNDYYLECSVCCDEEEEEIIPLSESNQEENNNEVKDEVKICPKEVPFYGHFVLVVNIDFENSRVIWKDSQEGSCLQCSIDWDIFEKARLDHRTDGDTIVCNIWGNLSLVDNNIQCCFFPAEELGYDTESDVEELHSSTESEKSEDS